MSGTEFVKNLVLKNFDQRSEFYDMIMKEVKRTKSNTDPLTIRSYYKGIRYLIDELKTDNENTKALLNTVFALGEQVQELHRRLLNTDNILVTIATILSQSSVTDSNKLNDVQDQLSQIENKGKNHTETFDKIEKHVKKISKTQKKRSEPKLNLIK